MKYLYLIVFVFISLVSQAQITHTPTPAKMVVNKDSFDVKFTITYKSEFEDDTKIYWKIIKDTTTWKSSWYSYLCDNILCYDRNVDRSSPSVPNTFSTGEYKWDFHIQPFGVEGGTIVQLVLYTDRNFTEEIYRTKIYVNVDPTSTQQTISANQIKVFPNPASEYFSITNQSNVDKIKVYNMFGAEVKSFFHYNNAQHQIDELRSGMYLLRMFDKNNKVVKTIKLNKIHSGA